MSIDFTLPPIPKYLRTRDRRSIEDQIEALIALLDDEDGDPDLEPEEDQSIEDVCHDADDSLLPAYGIDQSTGPINEAQAVREWTLAQRARAY